MIHCVGFLFRKYRLYGIGEVCKTVYTCDWNIFHTTVAYTIHDGEPKLCALIFADPHSQNIFYAVHFDADGNIYCLFDNLSFTAHMEMDRVLCSSIAFRNTHHEGIFENPLVKYDIFPLEPAQNICSNINHNVLKGVIFLKTQKQTKKNEEQNCTLSANGIYTSSKANNNTVRCSNIMELGKYFHISYDKALDLAHSPGFPKVIFNNEKPFPKAEIAAWLAERLGPAAFLK